MPDRDLDAELDELLGPVQTIGDYTPDKGLDAELDALLAAPPEPKVTELPVTNIEGDAPAAPATPPKQTPWYESLARGAKQAVTAGFGDELSGKLMSALPGPADPEGIPREYAAGSASADFTNVDRGANEKARKDNPTSFTAGGIAASIPTAIATGGGGLAGAMGTGAALTAASKLGNQEGNLSERVSGAAADAAEHPVTTAAEFAAPAVGYGVGKAAQAFSPLLKKGADKLMTQTFMSSPQRAAYEAAKGPGALSQLGSDARDAGLFKPTNPLGYLRPATAARVADNASALRASAGQKISSFEDGLAEQGINPDVQVSQITDGLRGKAANIRGGLDLDAAPDARTMENLARRIEQPENVSVQGSHTSYERDLPPALPEAQQGLPGVDASSRANAQMGQRNLDLGPESAAPAADGQMSFDMARGQKQAPWQPGSLEGVQESLPLPRSGQMSLPLDERAPQASLPFQSGAVPPPRPNLVQESLFGADLPQGTGPNFAKSGRELKSVIHPVRGGRPVYSDAQPVPGPAVDPGTTPPMQSQMDLSTQGDFGFPPPAPKEAPWKPGQQNAEQASLGLPNAEGSQGQLPFMSADKQLSLPLAEPKTVPLEATGELTRDAVPFTDAIRSKRYIADRLKFDKKTPPKSYGEEAARKYTWSELKDAISRSLEGDKRIAPEALQDYTKANKDYSTAMTAFDPALKMAERQGQAGLSLTDLMAGAAMGDGGLTAMAAKTGRGVLPATAAGTMRRVGNLSNLVGKTAQPTAISMALQENPNGKRQEIENAANEKAKEAIRARLQK